MKTKHRGQDKLVVEEFTVGQIKEYLTSVVKFSMNMEQLARMAIAAQDGRAYFAKTSQLFKIETIDKGEV